MNYRVLFIATLQTVGLFVAGGVIPLLGQAFALFTPVPLIVVSLRNSRKEGFMTLAAACGLVSLIGGWQAAAALFFSFGLMAIGIAEGMHRRMRPERTALLGGFLPIAVVGAALAIYLVKVGKNPFTEIDAYLREMIAAAAKTYTDLGLKEMASMISSIPESYLHYFSRLMPGITIATSVAQAAFCYGIARAIIARKQGMQPGEVPFASWHAPDSWVWGLIAALAFIVVPREDVRLAGWNLAIVFAVVYLAQGSAIVDYYLRRARLKNFIRGLFIGLILAMPTIVFVIALGIVDIWADFRKVRGPVRTA
ncbi:MAG TPA: DUF2232 domain-containing protein [Nitrospirota bacterium]